MKINIAIDLSQYEVTDEEAKIPDALPEDMPTDRELASPIGDFGLDYGELKRGTAGKYFKRKILEASDKDSYQYKIATSGNVGEWQDAYDIKDIQKTLNSLGFHLDIDGIYGPKTKGAAEQFGIQYLMDEIDAYLTDNDHNKITDGSDYVDVAKTQVGVTEWGVGDNPEVVKYHNSTNHYSWGDNVPWCASFMAWVFNNSGYEKAVPSNSARALSWLSFGKPIDHPVYGAVAVKRRKGGGHVCFVVGEEGRFLYCLGGNQSDRVSVVKYNKSVFEAFRVPLSYVESIPLPNNIIYRNGELRES